MADRTSRLTGAPPAGPSARRPTLAEFRLELGRLADGMSDETLSQLQDQVEWFARFAVEQTLAARAARAEPQLRKSA